jgi:Ca-activated chloride channel family protein
MNMCDQDKRLTPFLLGDLPGPEADAVRLHLAQCAACQESVRQIEPTLAALRNVLARDAGAKLQIPPACRARLLAVRPQSPRFRIIRWVSRPRAWLGIAAGLILGLGISSLYLAMKPGVYQGVSLLEMNVHRGHMMKWAPSLMSAPSIVSDEVSPEACGEPQGETFSTVTKSLSGETTLSFGYGSGAGNGGPGVVGGKAANDAKESGSLGRLREDRTYTFHEGRESERGEKKPASPPGESVDHDDEGQLRGNVSGLAMSDLPDAAGAGTGGREGERKWSRDAWKKNQPATAPAAATPPAPPEKPMSREPYKSKQTEETKSDISIIAPVLSAKPADAPEGSSANAIAESSVTVLNYLDVVEPLESPTAVRGQPSAVARSEPRSLPNGRKGGEAKDRQVGADVDGDDLRVISNEGEVLRLKGQVSEQKKKLDPLMGIMDSIVVVEPKSSSTETGKRRASLKPAAADEKPTSDKETLKRMKETTIPEIDFKSANIQDIAAFFNSASKEFGDGADKGIEFVTPGQTPHGTSVADPFAPNTPAVAGAPVTVRMRNVSMLDAAKIVADVSGTKLHFQDGKAVFVPANMPDEDIVTKIYNVFPSLAERIRGSAQASQATGDVTAFFAKQGLHWPSGSTALYDEKLGKLRVSNTTENLAKFEGVLAEWNVSPAAPRKPAAFNPFVDASSERFSTFSIDVDTASYTLTRQAILSGRLPEPEVVRTEEIVNAFDYGDAAPDRATFRVYVEGAPSPFGADLTMLRIGVKGRRLGREEQRPAMLTFLIDTSGSMAQPDRIGLARTALKLLLENLAPVDRIQIVAYDDRARVVLDPTPATEAAAALKAFDTLQCTGSTNLEDGMRKAYELAARAFIPGAENRVILVSDGVANLGAGDAQEILAQIDASRRQGITCSVFGVGKGTYNDQMLEQLANKGDGVYRFLDSEEEVRRAFVDDLAATLNTIATDVKIQVEWNPAAVRRYRQLGYENRALTKEQFRDDTVDAGEIGSGQSVSALYELEPESTVPARRVSLGTVRVRYRRIDTRAVEEIAVPIRPEMIARNLDASRLQFRLAVGAAEFAEILRASPYAAGNRFENVARLLRPVALALPLDTRVKELLGLVEAAETLSK